MNYTMILKLILPVIHEDALSKRQVSSRRKRQGPHLGPSTVVTLSFLPEFSKEILKENLGSWLVKPMKCTWLCKRDCALQETLLYIIFCFTCVQVGINRLL